MSGKYRMISELKLNDHLKIDGRKVDVLLLGLRNEYYLQEINYSWGELSIISDTEYHGDFDYMALPAKNCYLGPAFTPEDIDIKDTATFAWAIE